MEPRAFAYQPLADDLLHFHCSKLAGCKRCSGRREAARARLGTSPRKAFDSRIASMSPGRCGRPPRCPVSPPPCCPCPAKTEANGGEETCEIVEQLLEEFTERVQSFFLALMGFNHPHVDRLQAALDQQVTALGHGLMKAMALKDAFWALRRAVSENQLWKKLKQCRHNLFQ